MAESPGISSHTSELELGLDTGLFTEASSRRAPNGTQSLTRTLAILRALAESAMSGRPYLTLGALARTVGLAKSTVHRLLAGLHAHGLVARDDHGGYAIGSAFIGLGRIAEEVHAVPPAGARAAGSHTERDEYSTERAALASWHTS
ncbi:helix-turn-helix domain-containing protein [Brevibacterium samyangense]|uniref:HTH iclR-type domain-containing protein n=1 Tax=Brevibacterium samyangense TaxID=366888 RepID=A0ABN2TG55_9MICO